LGNVQARASGTSRDLQKKEIVLKVQDSDTIKEITKQIFAELDLKRPLKLFYTKSIQHHLLYSKSIQADFADCTCDDYTKLVTGNEYQKLSDDACTAKECGVVMFHHLLRLRVSLCSIKGDRVKHVYSVEIVDGLDTSHHDANDCLLSIKYNITIKKLYTMVAQHYKIFVWHIRLTVDGYGIAADDDMPLHKVLYSPIIMYEEEEDPTKPYVMLAYSYSLSLMTAMIQVIVNWQFKLSVTPYKEHGSCKE